MSSEKNIEGSAEETSTNVVQKHSVFTTIEKWCIISMAAYAAWLSTLSSFIYFPAIPTLAKTLGVSVSKINLTITTYLAVATIAPSLVGDAADIIGRRPAYLIILSLYSCANLAIALSKSYSALLGLRILQALAISGTFSIAYGVVTDVAAPAERGSFAALVSFASTAAPSLGPLLGGALTFAAGWPWIFWFLCIASGLCLAAMALFLPETSRKVVGNGSIPPPKYSRTPFGSLMQHWEDDAAPPPRKWRVPNPFASLAILFHKDNAAITTACGLLYSIYTCINASLSTLFVDIYNLNQWQTGLIYLPFGIGGVVSAFISGPLLDRAWRKSRLKLGLPVEKTLGDDLDAFPVEKTRLCVIWVPLLFTILSVIAFGWVLHFREHMAIPLTCQFIAGFCLQLDFSIYNTLLVDKNHRAPATAQAASNIMRCTCGAITISFLQNIIDAIGIGWTFTFFGGLCVIATLLFFIDYHLGTAWRQRRLHD